MSERLKILVVDDDAAAAEFLQELLQDAGYDVDAVTSSRAALERARAEEFAVIVSDIEMPDLRGVDLLREILIARPQQLVVLVTAFGSIDLAVECVKNGACDFVTKPFRSEVIEHVVARALRERHLRREIVRLRGLVDKDAGGDGIVARSPSMQRLLQLARRAAASDAPVLITGESGTGKTRLARYIHDQGRRASHAFVALNCAALPTTLAESELFGVRKGAFTGADSDRPGVFVEADGGTLFLDEIGELPWDVQPKLLHTLESGKLRPVGGKGESSVDVRVVAATNRALEEALKTQRFRPDLYFRLNVIRMELPPLRERREDIPQLFNHFAQAAAQRLGRKAPELSAAQLSQLLTHDWPGNVRELANAAERQTLGLSAPEPVALDAGPSLAAQQEAFEAHCLRAALSRHKGDIKAVLHELQLPRRTLNEKMQRHGLLREMFV